MLPIHCNLSASPGVDPRRVRLALSIIETARFSDIVDREEQQDRGGAVHAGQRPPAGPGERHIGGRARGGECGAGVQCLTFLDSSSPLAAPDKAIQQHTSVAY